MTGTIARRIIGLNPCNNRHLTGTGQVKYRADERTIGCTPPAGIGSRDDITLIDEEIILGIPAIGQIVCSRVNHIGEGAIVGNGIYIRQITCSADNCFGTVGLGLHLKGVARHIGLGCRIGPVCAELRQVDIFLIGRQHHWCINLHQAVTNQIDGYILGTLTGKQDSRLIVTDGCRSKRHRDSYTH